MFIEQQIRMISKWSRDTEDWKLSSVIIHLLKYIEEVNSSFKLQQYFFLDQINAALVSIRLL